MHAHTHTHTHTHARTHTHTHTQEDTGFLRQLFEELIDENTPIDRFRELAELLREINNFATLTQSALRLKLCTDFCKLGLMKAIVGMLVRGVYAMW